jgi:hypothetical protein
VLLVTALALTLAVVLGCLGDGGQGDLVPAFALAFAGGYFGVGFRSIRMKSALA